MNIWSFFHALLKIDQNKNRQFTNQELHIDLNSERLDDSVILQTQLNLKNQRTVRADAPRTRIQEIKQASGVETTEELEVTIEKVLTFYTKEA